MYRRSSGATLTCNLCNNLFKTKITLQDHISDQHGVDATFMCSKCDNLFSSNSDLEQHIRAYHSLQEPFKSHEDLKIHTNASHHTELSMPKAVLHPSNQSPSLMVQMTCLLLLSPFFLQHHQQLSTANSAKQHSQIWHFLMLTLKQDMKRIYNASPGTSLLRM